MAEEYLNEKELIKTFEYECEHCKTKRCPYCQKIIVDKKSQEYGYGNFHIDCIKEMENKTGYSVTIIVALYKKQQELLEYIRIILKDLNYAVKTGNYIDLMVVIKDCMKLDNKTGERYITGITKQYEEFLKFINR